MTQFTAVCKPLGFVCAIEPTKIVRVIDIDDLLRSEYVALRFERDIHWFRESETQIIVRNSKGKIVHEGSTYGDYYSFLHSVKAFDESEDYIERLRDTYEGATIEAVTTIVEQPFLLAPPEAYSHRVSRHGQPETYYLPVPGDWAFDDEQVEKNLAVFRLPNEQRLPRLWPLDDNAPHSRLNYVSKIKREQRCVIWSSANTDQENAAARAVLDQFRPKEAA